MRRREDGFTAVELMTVVAILGTLMTLAVASFVSATSTSHRVACVANQRVLSNAVPHYRIANRGAEPGSLEDLSGYVKSFAQASRCPADGRALVWDAAESEVRCTYPGH